MHELTFRPTRGWDQPIEPLTHELEIGDDLERCHRLCIEIISRGNTCVSDEEFINYFTELKLIARRFERFCQRNQNEFVFELEHLQACCMDLTTRNKYLKDLEDLYQRQKEREERISQLEDRLNSMHLY